MVASLLQLTARCLMEKQLYVCTATFSQLTRAACNSANACWVHIHTWFIQLAKAACNRVNAQHAAFVKVE